MDDKELKIVELEGKIEQYRESLKDLRESLEYYRNQCVALKEKVAGAKYLMKTLVKELDENIL